jgi:transposase-like protein
VAPTLLYQWRRLMAEEGVAAVGSDETVVGSSSEVRRLEKRVRDLISLALGAQLLDVLMLGRLMSF